jgi:hypothetical protein
VVTVASSVLGICLALEAALSPTSTVFLATDSFTLAWTHSIEKQRWEEDYRVVRDAKFRGGQGDDAGILLLPVRARVKGSGAGMEPGPDSQLIDGWFQYQPAQVALPSLRLSRSFFTEDFSLCLTNVCRNMSEILPSDGEVTLLWACEKTS